MEGINRRQTEASFFISLLNVTVWPSLCFHQSWPLYAKEYKELNRSLKHDYRTKSIKSDTDRLLPSTGDCMYLMHDDLPYCRSLLFPHQTLVMTWIGWWPVTEVFGYSRCEGAGPRNPGEKSTLYDISHPIDRNPICLRLHRYARFAEAVLASRVCEVTFSATAA